MLDGVSLHDVGDIEEEMLQVKLKLARPWQENDSHRSSFSPLASSSDSQSDEDSLSEAVITKANLLEGIGLESSGEPHEGLFALVSGELVGDISSRVTLNDECDLILMSGEVFFDLLSH